MRAGKRRGFWRRVVVWWVCLTVMIAGMGVGTLAWAGYTWTRPRMKWTGFLEARSNGSLSMGQTFLDMGIAFAGPFVTIANVYRGARSDDAGPYEKPPDSVEEWLTDAEIDAVMPSIPRAEWRRPEAVRRIRDAAGEILRQDPETLGILLTADVWFGAPIASTVATFPRFYTGTIVVPDAVRTTYPLVIPLDGGRTQAMIRIWNVLALSAAMSAVLVAVAAGPGEVRRAVRRRRGRCAWCGYSLVGIAEDVVCPECGEKR